MLPGIRGRPDVCRQIEQRDRPAARLERRRGRQVIRDRIIEGDLAALDHVGQHQGGHDLGDRSDLEHRAGVQGDAVDAGAAVSGHVRAVLVDDRGHHPGDARAKADGLLQGGADLFRLRGRRVWGRRAAAERGESEARRSRQEFTPTQHGPFLPGRVR
jgi:hypothetical protein